MDFFSRDLYSKMRHVRHMRHQFPSPPTLLAAHCSTGERNVLWARMLSSTTMEPSHLLDSRLLLTDTRERRSCLVILVPSNERSSLLRNPIPLLQLLRQIRQIAARRYRPHHGALDGAQMLCSNRLDQSHILANRGTQRVPDGRRELELNRHASLVQALL